jgi:hypothetical protein
VTRVILWPAAGAWGAVWTVRVSEVAAWLDRERWCWRKQGRWQPSTRSARARTLGGKSRGRGEECWESGGSNRGLDDRGERDGKGGVRRAAHVCWWRCVAHRVAGAPCCVEEKGSTGVGWRRRRSVGRRGLTHRVSPILVVVDHQPRHVHHAEDAVTTEQRTRAGELLIGHLHRGARGGTGVLA